MNKSIFELILYKVGGRFLEYVLNYESEINQNLMFEDYNFSTKQIESLIKLNKIIISSEIDSNKIPLHSLKYFIFNYNSYFNNIRSSNSGVIYKKNDEDELLNYLFEKISEFYPSLLISEIYSFRNNFNGNYFESNFPESTKEEEFLIRIIKRNPNLNELTSSSRIISYKLEDNNGAVNCFYWNFISKFIERCFLNCCYRLDYSIKSLFNEVENQYKLLIEISKKKKITSSFFIGIKGLRIIDSNEFYLNENIIIRNINERNNPGIKDTVSTTRDENDNVIDNGCIIEIIVKLTSLGKILENDGIITISNEMNDKTFHCLLYSLLFVKKDIIAPPIQNTFYDCGIPLFKMFPYKKDKFLPVSQTNITKNEFDEIKDWFLILNSKDLSFIKITLERIKFAIYDRHEPIDSLLDAFIAWESMFSSKISTTNSVTKSILKILERTNFKHSKTNINNYYSLRSSIVHGNPYENKIFKGKNSDEISEKIVEIKKEVIQIAVFVVKELLKDNLLYTKKPDERVKLLLNPEIVKCENCQTEKFNFNL